MCDHYISYATMAVTRAKKRTTRSTRSKPARRPSTTKRHRVRAGEAAETPAELLKRHGNRDVTQGFEQTLPIQQDATLLAYGSTNRGNDVLAKSELERRYIDDYNNLDFHAKQQELDRFDRAARLLREVYDVFPHEQVHDAMWEQEDKARRLRHRIDDAIDEHKRKIDAAHALVTSARKRQRAGEPGHVTTLEDMMRVPAIRERLFANMTPLARRTFALTNSSNDLQAKEFNQKRREEELNRQRANFGFFSPRAQYLADRVVNGKLNMVKAKKRHLSKRYADDGTWLGPAPTVANRPPDF
eukprot:jgi/Mesvir1/22120/Mv18723-RA.1